MCHPSKNSRPHTRRLLNLRLLYPRIHVRCLVTNIFLAGLQWVSNQFIILSSLTLLKWLVRYHDYVENENVKHNRVLWDKQQLCTCIALFCTFLRRHCTTTTWKYLISRLSLKQGDFFFLVTFSKSSLSLLLLVSQTKTAAAIYVGVQTSPEGVKPFCFVKTFFCSSTFAVLLSTWENGSIYFIDFSRKRRKFTTN